MLPVRQTATPVGNPRVEKTESGRCRSNARRTASDTKKFYNLNRLRFAASGANALTPTVTTESASQLNQSLLRVLCEK